MLKKLLKKISSRLSCQAGELYSIPLQGEFGILKILKVDTKGIHVCLYSNLYKKCPSKINEKELFINPKDTSATPHAPLTYSSMKLWRPSFLQDSEVRREELNSYFYWKEHHRYYI